MEQFRRGSTIKESLEDYLETIGKLSSEYLDDECNFPEEDVEKLYSLLDLVLKKLTLLYGVQCLQRDWKDIT